MPLKKIKTEVVVNHGMFQNEWHGRECVPVPGQMPGERYDYSGAAGGCRIMNKPFLILVVICIVLVSPAMAKDNPYKNAHKATPADVAVNIEADTVKLSETSGMVFDGAGYTHTIGRVSITMKPLLSKTGGTATVKGNRRRYGTDPIIEHELYRNLIKEWITLNSPETIRYSYDIRISDWVTTEPDESRPKETAGQNSTMVTTYPYTKKITNYAKDSTSDIALDPWGNLVVYVNGEDIVVIPKPFAVDTTGKRFEMDFSLDKDDRIITINGDLSGALYPIVVDPTEILTNGGFETGDLEGWNSNYYFYIRPYITSSGCHTGTYCAQFYSADYGEYYGSLVQTVAIATGNQVSMSVAAAGTDIHWSVGGVSALPGRKITGDTGNYIAGGSATTLNWYSGSQTVPSSYSYMWGAAYAHPMKMDSCSVLQYSLPVANFTATPLAGTAPLTVQFTDTSTGSPTSWSWNFGDGGSSAEQNPQHTYATAGTYTVRLTATNAAGSDTMEKAGMITVEGYTYSITVSESFRDDKSDLRPFGSDVGDNIASTLNSAGWIQKFYHKDFKATEEDFGILDAPLNQGLDESILHYHFGHGSKNRGLVLVKLNEIGDIPLVPRDFLQPIQVANKWDYKNKWVIFDACELVGDPRWGDALVTSHGILGFKSTKTPDPQLPVRFFHYAMDEDRTVADAWMQATQDLYYKTGIIAAYRFDNTDQLDRDHLPGHGEMAPDEYPDDSSSRYWQWEC